MLLTPIKTAVVAVTSLWALPFLRSHCPSLLVGGMYNVRESTPGGECFEICSVCRKMFTVSGVVFGLLAR